VRVALVAPRAARVVVRGLRSGGCARVWRAPSRRARRACAAVDLPARSLAVLTFAPGRA